MTLFDTYSGATSASATIYDDEWRAEQFTAIASYSMTSVDLDLFRTGLPGDVTLSIRAVTAGVPVAPDLATATYDGDLLGIDSTGEWVTFTLDAAVTITKGTTYAIVIRALTGSITRKIHWDAETAMAAWPDGHSKSTTGGGDGSWTNYVDAVLLFKAYGDGAVPVDKTYSRKLVAIGNDEVWHESPAGTMVELAAATGLDVTKPLTATTAFQKMFIANTTNLKVVDFANTKLTIAALTTVPTRGSTVTQLTSNATMVVDFVNGAKTEIYGYTTSGTDVFVTTAGYTISGGGLASANSLVPTAVNEASTLPHWYDLTEYDTTKALSTNMPASAYLTCLYRGRLVLSGNPTYPHQWYMSKVADPWNWDYTSTDPLTAVAGNNTTAGEIGDVVRTLIPFGDDFLVFGCSNSVHVLDGDPASGGSIDEVSNNTGIFSFTSWCKDEEGNLYFYGNHGIYKMMGGRSKPINISKTMLPNLSTDWAVNPSTHRVVFAYDTINRGVVIIKTTLADGTCSGYFYSLDIEGFYPISFANTADGIYCSLDYNADDPTYRKLLFGCTDGYIRRFLGTNKNDDYGSASTEPISSYFVTLEPLAEDSDKEGKLTSLTVELAGGGTGGDFTDSDGCGYKTYVANDAETCLEKTKAITAWATGILYAVGDLRTYGGVEYRCITAHTSDETGPPFEEPNTNTTDWEIATFSTGTLTGTGRKNRIRNKIRAAWLAIKLYNSTESETFGINKVYGDVKEAGKIK